MVCGAMGTAAAASSIARSRIAEESARLARARITEAAARYADADERGHKETERNKRFDKRLAFSIFIAVVCG